VHGQNMFEKHRAVNVEAMTTSNRLPSVFPRSMHETSLSPRKWVLPEIKGLHSVQAALEGDAEAQLRKYNSSEPSCLSARFHVRLPSSPQNQKYSRRRKSLGDNSSISGNSQKGLQAVDARPPIAIPQGNRFDKSSLMVKFREMDLEGSGFIKKRAFIMFLHEQLAQAGHAQRDIPKLARDLFKDMEANISQSFHWDDFIEVIRKAGLLAEYDFQAAVNQQQLAMDLEQIVQDARTAQRTSVMPGVDDVIDPEFKLSLGAQRERRFKVKRRVSALDLNEDDDLEFFAAA